MVLQFSRNNKFGSIPGKLLVLHFDVLFFSNPGEKVLKSIISTGRICPIVFLLFMTFSPGVESNNTLKCYFNSFAEMLTFHFAFLDPLSSFSVGYKS